MLSESQRGQSETVGRHARAYPLQQSDEIETPAWSEERDVARYDGPEDEEEE